MSTATTQIEEDRSRKSAAGAPRLRAFPIVVFVVVAVVAVALLAGVHLVQGTADVRLTDLLALLFDGGEQEARNVLFASRLPRLLAVALVGVALGVAGGVFQSIARNSLASPDTMGVNAGGFLAVTLAAVTGFTLPFAIKGGIAFVGGLAGTALVLALSRGGTSGPTRLILAGATISLTLGSVTMLLLVLFEQETVGLYQWGAGSVVQSGMDSVASAWPWVLLGVVGSILLAHRLDLLALGDDTANVLGLNVPRTRLLGVLAAVLLSAAALTVAGPIGFVGLAAPVIVRLISARIPGLQRHIALLPLAGLVGVLIVLLADVLLRLFFGDFAGVRTPAGLVTSLFGASFLVVLARRIRDESTSSAAATVGRPRTTGYVRALAAVLAAVLSGALLLGALLGEPALLTGDVLHWIRGDAGRIVTAALNERLPRVLAAALAGTALAIAGTVVQAVCRNPLAEPGLLGITAGAGVGAVCVVALFPLAGVWAVAGAASATGLLTFAVVYGLAYRRGLNSDRLVLIGVGMGAGASAITTAVVLATNPYNLTFALTWLSGTTYGRIWAQLVPVIVVLLVITPVLIYLRHRMDLLAVDDDTPRVLGVPLERTRLIMLISAALLSAAAVSAIGVVGFVGLIAPHAARALVGSRSSHVMIISALLGAILVSLADTVGRTVLAPAQFPAGLVTALIGAPYFIYLLWRTRTTS